MDQLGIMGVHTDGAGIEAALPRAVPRLPLDLVNEFGNVEESE